MSSSLARRTGTVGALVAAASVTLVAGAWPALAAAPADPRSAEVQGIGKGLETAPGQVQEPTAEPVPSAPAGPVAPEPVLAEPVVAEPVVAEPVVAEPVVEEPAATSPRGRSGLAPGRGRIAPQAPVTEPTAATVEPAAEPVAEPVVEAPVVGPATGLGKGRDTKAGAGRPEPAPRSAPVAAPEGEPPAVQDRGADVRADRGPAADAPAAGQASGPAAGPVSGPVSAPVVAPRSLAPVVGPVAPAVRPVAAAALAPVMGPQVPRVVRPSALATAGAHAGRAQVAATDAQPLRPTGADPIALPAAVVRPRPEPMRVDLGTALPSVAAKTAEAVARTPEWPLGIAGVVLVFLLVQNRIDRRDPKLAAARVEDEAPLEFAPLAGHPHLRLVVAA